VADGGRRNGGRARRAPRRVGATDPGGRHRIGKFGGRELTTGSDLDLFVVYERAGSTDGASPVEAHVFYDRVVERLSELLGDITAAGIVFPVDLRLRPGSKGSGFATSLDAVEQYYLEWADPWERQTLTRARLVGGDPRLGRTLRKRLDALVYGPVALPPDLKEMRGLRDRMEKELGKESPGRLHVKFGRGGLVDVEFITQALQMLDGRTVRRCDTRTRFWRSGRSGTRPPAARRLRRDHPALSLPPARVGRLAPLRGPTPGYARAGGADSRSPGEEPRLSLAEGVSGGLSAPHDAGARAIRSSRAPMSPAPASDRCPRRASP
jgi:hypothetical protein